MNILVIKTTSLGDVLHATPHLRAIKKRYPDAHLTVLTAASSAEIYAHNPAVDRLVLFDHARFKKLGLRSPRKLITLIRETLAQINEREYALAFDLQGLLRTVVFLYFARAKHKYVKGRWPGLDGFRDKRLHAIDEMTQVLAAADIPVTEIGMEFNRAPEVANELRTKLQAQSLNALLDKSPEHQFIVISPFTRWASKNWPLQRFVQTACVLNQTHRVIFTGTAGDCDAIAASLKCLPEAANIVNFAGQLNLAELAELMSHAALVISGDSFPMHLATATGAPLVTLFGPTDECKTGPRSANSLVLRPDDCRRCDKPDCARACLAQISTSQVESACRAVLGREGIDRSD